MLWEERAAVPLLTRPSCASERKALVIRCGSTTLTTNLIPLWFWRPTLESVKWVIKDPKVMNPLPPETHNLKENRGERGREYREKGERDRERREIKDQKVMHLLRPEN